jgi:hypothetical protein
VGVGTIVVVWFRQGKRKIMMLIKKYRKEKESKS